MYVSQEESPNNKEDEVCAQHSFPVGFAKNDQSAKKIAIRNSNCFGDAPASIPVLGIDTNTRVEVSARTRDIHADTTDTSCIFFV